MIKYSKALLNINQKICHINFDKSMDADEMDTFLKTITNPNTTLQWHPENTDVSKHFPFYLNKLSDGAWQIYGSINGVACKQSSGPQTGLFIAEIKFFDYHKRLIKLKMLPCGQIADLYDRLTEIYEDEIESAPYETDVRYLLYISVDENGHIHYIDEKIMNSKDNDVPTFKDKIKNADCFEKLINWMPKRITKPNEPGVYQIVVNAKWSPLSSRTIEVLSCTPICIF